MDKKQKEILAHTETENEIKKAKQIIAEPTDEASVEKSTFLETKYIFKNT